MDSADEDDSDSCGMREICSSCPPRHRHRFDNRLAELEAEEINRSATIAACAAVVSNPDESVDALASITERNGVIYVGFLAPRTWIDSSKSGAGRSSISLLTQVTQLKFFGSDSASL